ncbi:MAG: hypothetical protein WB762_31460 [Candidatus Sulfotelmatobacter sp.]
MSCGDGRDPQIDDVCFEFASTNDSGQSWSIVHPKIVDSVPQTDFDDWSGYSGNTYLDFADTQHGWAILEKSHNVTASLGVTLRTVDGGHTWTQLAKGGMPIADHFHFVTAKDGWIQGGPDQDLYCTHDGGDTWSKVAVNPPAAIKLKVWLPAENGVWPDYRLPFFENPERGFLIGSYRDDSESTPTSVLFSTTDLGNTWKFEKVLANIDGVIAIFDETLFAVSTPTSMNKLTFTRLPLIGKTEAPATVTSQHSRHSDKAL